MTPTPTTGSRDDRFATPGAAAGGSWQSCEWRSYRSRAVHVLPVELGGQVRDRSGEALIGGEKSAVKIARRGDVQRVAGSDVVAHLPGRPQQRTTDRDAANVQPCEPSQQFIDLGRWELSSAVESRQSGEDLGIEMRDGDQRCIAVIGQMSTDALTVVAANEQVDNC